MKSNVFKAVTAVALTSCVASMALAGAHTWTVNEIFSNADGTIQFIELKECCGFTGEIFVNGMPISSDATGHVFNLPGNLSGNTANRHILLATAGFANLPGAPTPDHIIPDGFFSPVADTVRYYGYHALSHSGIPTDCIQSRLVNGTNAVNSPTNYFFETGSVNCAPTPPPCAGDIAPPGGDGTVGVPDLLKVISSWGPCPAPRSCDADIAPPGGDGSVGVPDLLKVISSWGPCPQ